ncbi:hypothetical protein DFJ43DRAFT_1152824 [Lentinula guzmanii]|uniref:Uncharacterized protein n=1 Tax=Lentinula guzmanii TaxID=2804957 RepID=A0AA38JNE6_9AGAR|nr:hypothetical protein DFJ43DRAFT_1157443 [Lentinula guzmanii]KAJ3733670.1 hypothetical protein DFJ43DRAFT_1152824 [Lentinula guzmanii]
MECGEDILLWKQGEDRFGRVSGYEDNILDGSDRLGEAESYGTTDEVVNPAFISCRASAQIRWNFNKFVDSTYQQSLSNIVPQETAQKRRQTRRKNRFISDEAQDDQEEGTDEDNTRVERTSEEDAMYQEQRKMEYQARLDGEQGRSDSNDVHNTMTRSGDMSMPSIFTGIINNIETRYGLGEYFSSPPSPAPGPSHPHARSLAPPSPNPSALSVPLHPPSPPSVSRSSKAHPFTSPHSINPSTGKPVWIKTPMDTSWAFSQAHTRKSLWVGNQIVVVKHPSRKGYRGTVGDVRQNDTYSSGLGTLIHYDVIGVGSEWLDFDDIRNAHTLRFLHDHRNTGLDVYYRFKAGYTPTYSKTQRLVIEAHDVKLRADALYNKVVNDDNKRYEDELRALMSVEIPKPHEWILDPRFKVALGDLEFSIMVHSGKFCSNKDQLVHIGCPLGKLEIRIRPSRRKRGWVEVIPVSDICNMPSGGVRTKAVPAKPREARGLYLIASSDDVKTHDHVGKLVRRVREARVDESPFAESSESMYLCQRVNLHQVAGRGLNYEEEIIENEEPFVIHYSHLLSVHQTDRINSEGNKKMYKIRTAYGGLTMLCDEPESTQAQKDMSNDIAQLQERIRCARRTPPPPPQPTPVDWDSITLP